MFVRHADETACLDDRTLEPALRACRADALWVGPGARGRVRRGRGALRAARDRVRRTRSGRAAAAGRGGRAPSEDSRRAPSGRVRHRRRPGRVWALGVCDCSCRPMRRDAARGVIEHRLCGRSGASELMDAARRLALRCRLLRRRHGRVRLRARVAARLDPRAGVPGSDHAVTEAVTGLDPVKLQLLLVAAGGRSRATASGAAGHAIEVHLRAEDPTLAFAPAPGRLVHLRLPTGPGLRVDSGWPEGDTDPRRARPD